MSKQVTIIIDPDDLTTLRTVGGNPYKLCFARKVGNVTNVVWSSNDEYGTNNVFSWIPLFQLFATHFFADGVKVVVTSNKVPIALGQQSTLDNRIVLSNPAGDQTSPPAVDKESIRMVNNWEPIHAGLFASSSYNGVQSATPVYVSPDLEPRGTVDLTPKPVVRIWFERDIETSVMYENSISEGIEIDLTKDDAATTLYRNGQWSTPSASVLESFDAEFDGGRLIMQIVVAVVGPIVSVVNLISSIRWYLGSKIGHVVQLTYSLIENKLALNFSEDGTAGRYAKLQLRTIAGDAEFRQILVDAAIFALGFNNVPWTDMDVRVS